MYSVFKSVFVLFILISGTSPLYAESEQIRRARFDCMARVVELMAKEDNWLWTSSLNRACACIVNNQAQGLSIYSCPKYRVIEHNKIRRYFGDYR